MIYTVDKQVIEGIDDFFAGLKGGGLDAESSACVFGAPNIGEPIAENLKIAHVIFIPYRGRKYLKEVGEFKERIGFPFSTYQSNAPLSCLGLVNAQGDKMR